MNGLLGAGLTTVLAAAVVADGALPALKSGIFPTLLLALTAAAAAGAGRRLTSKVSGDFDETEKTVAGATLGLGLLALAEFGLGAAGFLKPWAASTLLGALWIYAWPEIAPAAAFGAGGDGFAPR